MAIDLTGLSSTATSSSRTRVEGNTGSGQPAKGGKGVETAKSQPETVKLSNQALSLQKLEEQAAALPEVNSDRVAQIKQAIDEGSYQVNADRVAAKMIGLEQQLFG
ncbi:flagellar biosynthesis anti-sigma factor FlgM [Motiliproteus sp. SC1-56]|uniref:flagellar biosynthesis anti-sigma factor FlgM n=1 Tax=Motiliproteus sp. SC1-56 TaxID=2799565 RepID=UPI001A8C322D|nr:flagellar biosynthesis anti-sigma factor FlgM [Motiliproteus sp. SC1-56]